MPMIGQWIDDMLATAKIHSHVYMIEMRKNQSRWFFLDIEAKTEVLTQVLWTPSLRNAHLFLEEETVEEFKSEYISPRKVSIIRIPSIEMLLAIH